MDEAAAPPAPPEAAQETTPAVPAPEVGGALEAVGQLRADLREPELEDRVYGVGSGVEPALAQAPSRPVPEVRGKYRGTGVVPAAEPAVKAPQGFLERGVVTPSADERDKAKLKELDSYLPGPNPTSAPRPRPIPPPGPSAGPKKTE